ncbi:MAG: ferredoxin-thioredoxin reductase catalytic domain-containing protein [Dehalococcoidales bacterium]
MKKAEIKKAWEEFTEKNDFMLNPDEDHVFMVIEGVLTNENDCGLKLCPCRLRDGTRKGDLELICPCNFKSQDIWKTEGRCWCGLFVKRNR